MTKILITGCSGTIGKHLISFLLKENIDDLCIIGIDNSENHIVKQISEFKNTPNVNFYLGNICCVDSISSYFEGVDVVFHLAALKHVITSEISPALTVDTNIQGLLNVINCCKMHNVKRFVFSSSDKAVNPSSVMGVSKLMGERIVSAQSSIQSQNPTIFCSVRFGNVLGSSGSVYPIFKKQISNKIPLSLTSYEMTRYLMTPLDACSLLMQASRISKGGEVFISRMPCSRISDLAQAMIEYFEAQLYFLA